jgi:hypothetical protein
MVTYLLRFKAVQGYRPPTDRDVWKHPLIAADGCGIMLRQAGSEQALFNQLPPGYVLDSFIWAFRSDGGTGYLYKVVDKERKILRRSAIYWRNVAEELLQGVDAEQQNIISRALQPKSSTGGRSANSFRAPSGVTKRSKKAPAKSTSIATSCLKNGELQTLLARSITSGAESDLTEGGETMPEQSTYRNAQTAGKTIMPDSIRLPNSNITVFTSSPLQSEPDVQSLCASTGSNPKVPDGASTSSKQSFSGGSDDRRKS